MKKLILLWAMTLVAVQTMAQVTKEVTLSESGKLKSQISSGEAKTIEKLIVMGEVLNAKDMEFIGKMSALRTLDIHLSKGMYLRELKKPVSSIKELILRDNSDGQDIPLYTAPKSVKEEIVWVRRMEKEMQRFVQRPLSLVEYFPNMERCEMIPNVTLDMSFLPAKVWRYGNLFFQRDGSIVWTKDETTVEWTEGDGSMRIANGNESMTTDVNLQDYVYVGSFAYPKCDISRLTIPKETRYIDEYAFINRNLYRNSIDEIVTEVTDQPLYIGKHAFSDRSLTSGTVKRVTFNRPVYIEPEAFVYCSLDSITFNSDVEFIGKEAFASAQVLTFAKVPQTLTKQFIGSYNEVHIPSGTESQFANLGLSREKLFEEGGELLTLSIKMEKPGTILSHIPVDKMSSIGSLTIVGFLYETDIQILSQLRSLTYLDISKTYTTYSPEYLKNRREQQEYQAAMLKLLGKAATADYIDGNMAPSDYFFTQALVKIASEAPIDESEPGCVLPDEAFKGLKKLETIKLPLRLSSMGRKVLRSCTNLRHVEMPPHLQSIGTGSFGVCKNLENITIPSSLKSIGEKGYEADPYGPDPHVCTFDFSGVKTLDFSRCVFEKDDWLVCLRKCDNLQSVRLPQNIKWVSNLSVSPNVHYYFPATLKAFLQFWGGAKDANLHFKSQTPPDLSGNTITNCTIYCPKDCTTAYYTKFGAENKYIEE